MKLTVSVIKADIGSVGGHIAPSSALLGTVESHVRENGKNVLKDAYVSYTGEPRVSVIMRAVPLKERSVDGFPES